MPGSASEEPPAASPDPSAHSEPSAGAVTGNPGQRSIGPAETPSVGRWRAYVWPAIALRIEDAVAPLLTSLDRFVEVRVLPDALVEAFAPSALFDSVGLAGPPVRHESPAGDSRPSSGPALPEEEMGLLATLLVALLTAMGLVALARLVVGEDLFERRHWRGHRG
ncbi:MAG TPA: hypothetical protein VJU14_09645 [Solirubrobacterales bacterium]|nr:hypothetical protein [Solirubrobacterales bacterium]